MKKLTLFSTLLLFVVAANAQYDINYTFWNTAMNPNNDNAKAIKKAGLKSVNVVSYEPDADDTAETLQNVLFNRYDADGRVAYISETEGGNRYTEYAYDKKGRVTKYTSAPGFWIDFEYDKKGIKIKHRDTIKNRWDAVKNLFTSVSPLDTQYHYFNKGGKLEKHVRVHREANYAKGFFYSDTTYYTYDKKDNLSSFKFIELNKFGDTIAVSTGEYTYNKKGVLTKAIVKHYSSESNLVDEKTGKWLPELEEEYTYAVSAKSGRVVTHSYVSKKNYRYGGSINTDTNFIDEGYTYSPDGLLIGASRSVNPGVVTQRVYTYTK